MKTVTFKGFPSSPFPFKVISRANVRVSFVPLCFWPAAEECLVPYPRSRTDTPGCHLVPDGLSVDEASSTAGPVSVQTPEPEPTRRLTHDLKQGVCKCKNSPCQPGNQTWILKHDIYKKMEWEESTCVILVVLLEAGHQLGAVSEQLLL